ncbi:alpha/beta fold hydrolase [Streptomyces sp. B1866]|uniref:alpha/beta fold hydrolase n=1 Tax=Streptomyces sp. B1866 TaxID=3075431 RepID=UPI00289092FD|nr:alpha/beta fold hydrolase [Streptomyces sp. B1866]MDT3398006.1 alpha/beta fold hydrolase [Streptomyces sp. B1866]
MGAEARVAACDVADRDQLAGLLAGLDRPLTAVIHATDLPDDGLAESLTAERVASVMGPKVDAALHLHELTAGTDLAAFVLFSSAAALTGGPGQAGHAAAGAALDALAAARRAAGLPGTSLAWDPGAGEPAGTGPEQSGVSPLPVEEAPELFDRALGSGAALLVPVRLDAAVLRGQARAGLLPALLRGLVRIPARRAQAGGSLAQRLAGVVETERKEVVLEVVRAQVASVLGHASAAEVDPDRAFKDLGMDSLSAVELRNRLSQATGLALPAAFVFDHPTPANVARQLLSDLGGASPSGSRGAGSAPVPQNGHGVSGTPGTLSTLLRHAAASGTMAQALPWLVEASRFRPAFASAAELAEPDGHVVRLATGQGGPKLVCVPSYVYVVGSGPEQFLRLADRFDGERDVLVCSLPGFRGSEPAPASWDAALEVLENAVRRAVGDEPFVLVGYSMGGVVAHSLAARFEAAGRAPAGVVLLDTLAPEGGPEEFGRVFAGALTAILEREQRAVEIDDASWLAMGTYTRLLGERRADAAVSAPTLMVRAAEPLGASGSAPDWPAWEVCDDQVELAADHFALLEAGSAATADAIEGWLRR